eukprot:TRINITY_DN59607_c0_g1_i2.p1 TRINITY_DN59607_c0_g1~~TRINITY_DN59607_c0_g1_i2.p1  ORF type:complete len:307 (-),score=43.96 TRINITY_DN59607_c0_g1_i2:162-1082(-)
MSYTLSDQYVLESEWVNRLIDLALEEDLNDLGDLASQATILQDKFATARFLAKATGVLSGQKLADKIFKKQNQKIQIDWQKFDGEKIEKGEIFAQVTGPARSILTAERIVLNFMQRMSGIATLTQAMAEQIQGSKMKILDTRKTVPGLRLLDKLAVVHGGGSNHRMGLYDMMMIKDNHIAAAGGVQQALTGGDAYLKENNIDSSVKIEIETETLEDVQHVLDYLDEKRGETRLFRIMLDNMVKGTDISLLKKAVELVDNRLETEASGNVTIDTVGAIAESGVDFVSTGSLTHSVKALDISLKIQLQ